MPSRERKEAADFSEDVYIDVYYYLIKQGSLPSDAEMLASEEASKAYWDFLQRKCMQNEI